MWNFWDIFFAWMFCADILSVDMLQQYYTVIDKYLQGDFVAKYRKIAYNVRNKQNVAL